MQDTTSQNNRIRLLDALRGFCIILVIAYHIGYNLVEWEYIPEGALYNPVLNVLQPFFAGVFIVLAGVSSRFSRNNFKRGFQLLGCALLVTAVSYAAGSPVYFGILHLLACCILLYALLDKWRLTVPFTAISGFFLLRYGITTWPNVPSADYFPLIPWVFVFLFGVWLGGPIRDGTFPKWFYTADIPVFPSVGRHTLLIYLLHQPVLYGILWIVEALMG